MNNQVAAFTDQKARDTSQESSNVTFNVHANLVEVRVVVRDKNDKPVENLTRDDFEVYDRGKLQTISTFAVESPDTKEKTAIAPAPVRLTTVTTLPKRFVALVFDDTNISLQQSLQIRNASQLFVRCATSTDRIGIFSSSRQVTQDFTSDAGAIQRAILNVVPRPVAITNQRECPNVPYSMASRIENNQDQEALDTVIHETLICAFGGEQRKINVMNVPLHRLEKVGSGSLIVLQQNFTNLRICSPNRLNFLFRRYRERYGHLSQTLAADITYRNGELLQWLDERGIAAYIRVKENPDGPTDLNGIDQFTYVPEENCYVCPEGKPLKYFGINPLNRTHVIIRQ